MLSNRSNPTGCHWNLLAIDCHCFIRLCIWVTLDQLGIAIAAPPGSPKLWPGGVFRFNVDGSSHTCRVSWNDSANGEAGFCWMVPPLLAEVSWTQKWRQILQLQSTSFQVPFDGPKSAPMNHSPSRSSTRHSILYTEGESNDAMTPGQYGWVGQSQPPGSWPIPGSTWINTSNHGVQACSNGMSM